MYQQGRLSGRTSPASQQGRPTGGQCDRTSPAIQQDRCPGRVSPTTVSRVHDRLDDLFNQLRDGLRMVEGEDMVALLEELLERIDSRMVARYGPGNRPCPNAECPHRYEDYGRGRPAIEPAYSRGPEPWTAPTGDQTARSTKDNARKIVINAVTNALVQASGQPATQSAVRKTYTTTTSYASSGQFRPSGASRQPTSDHSGQSYGGVRPPVKARDSTERDILAMQTVDAGRAESNRAYVLRREARSSLIKYSPRPDALLQTMPQVSRQAEDAFYDAPESRSPGARSTGTPSQGERRVVYETSRQVTTTRHEATAQRGGRSDESRDSQYPTFSPSKMGRTSPMPTKQTTGQSAQNVFTVSETTPCQTFKRIQAPRTTKDEAYQWQDRSQSVARAEPKEAEKDSSDEDIWYNARDRFSSSSLVKSSFKHVANAEEEEEFVPVQIVKDEKRRALLKHPSSAVVPLKACKDTNLIFKVNRTLRQSLPKFTGSRRMSRGLLHLVGSVLEGEDAADDEYYPDISYADFEDLKGEEDHRGLTAGDATMTYSYQQPVRHATTTTSRSASFRDTVQKLTGLSAGTDTVRTAGQSEYATRRSPKPEYAPAGKKRQEILKVVKDSKENIKVEFSLPKEEQPQLAEFVSTFIDAQRKGKTQTEARTQTHCCAQCGRAFPTQPLDSVNNNRSSKAGSPFRCISPERESVKSSSTSKGSSPRPSSPYKSAPFGSPGSSRSVSPAPSSGLAEAYVLTHGTDSERFRPSALLNSAYGNNSSRATREYGTQPNPVADGGEPERGKTVQNKGSFLGEICGCN